MVQLLDAADAALQHESETARALGLRRVTLSKIESAFNSQWLGSGLTGVITREGDGLLELLRATAGLGLVPLTLAMLDGCGPGNTPLQVGATSALASALTPAVATTYRNIRRLWALAVRTPKWCVPSFAKTVSKFLAEEARVLDAARAQRLLAHVAPAPTALASTVEGSPAPPSKKRAHTPPDHDHEHVAAVLDLQGRMEALVTVCCAPGSSTPSRSLVLAARVVQAACRSGLSDIVRRETGVPMQGSKENVEAPSMARCLAVSLAADEMGGQCETPLGYCVIPSIAVTRQTFVCYICFSHPYPLASAALR